MCELLLLLRNLVAAFGISITFQLTRNIVCRTFSLYWERDAECDELMSIAYTRKIKQPKFSRICGTLTASLAFIWKISPEIRAQT